MSRVDVLILTAIDLEYKAVRSYLSDVEFERCEKGIFYYQGIFTSGSYQWKVGLVETGKGTANVVDETKDAIGWFKPKILLFVGIAGGVKGKVNLGDVVAAAKVYGYESGRVTGAEFLPRPDIGSANYSLEQAAKHLVREEKWFDRIIENQQESKVDAYVGAIASGDKKIESTNSKLYEHLLRHYDDMLAVEMEGYGFHKAIHADRNIEALIIRGISDLIDDVSETRPQGYRERAASHASAFAFEMLAVLSPYYLKGKTIPPNSSDSEPKAVTQPSPSLSSLLATRGLFKQEQVKTSKKSLSALLESKGLFKHQKQRTLHALLKDKGLLNSSQLQNDLREDFQC